MAPHLEAALVCCSSLSCHSNSDRAVTPNLSSCPGERPALENNLLALSFGFGVTHSSKLVVIFSRWHPSGESSACGCKCPGQALLGPLLPNEGKEETKATLEIALAIDTGLLERSLRLPFLF